MQKRHTDKVAYFEEQAITTREYVIPFIEKNIELNSSTNVLEIGCGEGGNLIPFLEKNCMVTGIDISQSKIEIAESFLRKSWNTSRLKLIARDIYDASDDLSETYDVIIMRDVIEHIHDQDRFMDYVKRFLKKEGIFFLAFPPWQNPFGGHQQICVNKILSHLPYFHLLPGSLYRAILRTGGEHKEKIDALLEIKETGISIERFKRILKKHSYKIIQESHYLFNPNYEIKFGLKPRRQWNLISETPVIRNFLTTAVYITVSRD